MSPLEYSLEYSRKRLSSVLEEIKHLKESEFPYPHSEEALKSIRAVFENHLQWLSNIPSGRNPANISARCATALSDLFNYLPLLGLVLRSTNVRNAFEVYGPLLSLAHKLGGMDTKLILSSEWDYSPLIYHEITDLPNFVLIGFPAPESSNPLLIPLAGHELGHTIWQARSLETQYRSTIEGQILSIIEGRINEYNQIHPNHNVKATDKKADLDGNIFVKQTIAPVVAWSVQQLEEYFCDFVGLRIFDVAYLHASAYMISPKYSGNRTMTYPNIRPRMSKMIEAAGKFKLQHPECYGVPPNYLDLFENAAEPSDREKRFLLSLADGAAATVSSTLISQVESILASAGVPVLEPKVKQEILDTFKFVIPARDAKSLTNVLNAAWDVFHDRDFWRDIPRITADNKDSVLKELVLKNIEVLEIEQLLHQTP